MNSSEQYGKSNNSQRGFTLIEVMVAMLIVSVGILGVAGIQLVSLQQNQSAMLNSEALMLMASDAISVSMYITPVCPALKSAMKP